MSDLPDLVEQSIRARRLFRPGQPMLVAVSGGVDSVVLLRVLHELAHKHHWRLTAAHFNHRLRGRSSDADERLVRRTAESLKVPLLIGGSDVRTFARARKLSLEMAARKLRHDFLARAAAQRGIPSVALAHHADDQLELFFLRLLRGSGGEGLAGMKWRNPSPSDPEIELVHPLLDQPKAALREYAAERGIRYREDASNAALDFQRNRIRHELLPLLRRKYQPALDRTISRVMDILGAEAEFAAEAARRWLGELRKGRKRGWRIEDGEWPETRGENLAGVRPSSGAAAFAPPSTPESSQTPPLADVAAPEDGRTPVVRPDSVRPSTRFDQLPVAVQRRCVQLQLLRQGIVPDFELVEQLRTAAGRPVAVSRAQEDPGPGGTPGSLCVVRDRAGLVHLQAAEPEVFKSSAVDMEMKGRAGEVEFDGARISWQVDKGDPSPQPSPLRKGRGGLLGSSQANRGPGASVKAGVGWECFDADRVGSLVRLRHWQPGDRFQPIGMACPVKLQDLFTNQKVPRDRRRRLLVAATAKGEVFWVEGMRISERFKLTKETIRRLQWRWKRL